MVLERFGARVDASGFAARL